MQHFLCEFMVRVNLARGTRSKPNLSRSKLGRCHERHAPARILDRYILSSDHRALSEDPARGDNSVQFRTSERIKNKFQANVCVYFAFSDSNGTGSNKTNVFICKYLSVKISLINVIIC